MPDAARERPDDALLHAPTLAGLESDCPVCGGHDVSTGWLLARGDDERRYLDMICAECGSRGGAWKLSWQPAIDAALATLDTGRA